MWFVQQQNLPCNPNPTHYIDLSGEVHKYTDADAEDAVLSKLRLSFPEHYFDVDRIPVYTSLNFKLTKKIKENFRLAFYVNRLLAYHPSYLTKFGTRIYRNTTPYFGMEISIKI